MSAILPQWRDLENRIALAPAYIKEHGQLHGKGYSFDDWNSPTNADWFAGLVLLSIFYISRNTIAASKLSVDFKIFVFAVSVFVFLPFVYLRLTEWGNGLVYFPGNWIFMPFATLFVPTSFFLRDITKESPPTRKKLFLRSLLEMFILTPVWFVVSVFLMLFLGFAWI